MTFNIFDNYHNENTLFKKIKYLLISLFFIYIGIALSAIIIACIDYFIVNILHYQSVKELFNKSTRMVNKRNVYYVILIGPFVEELLFRLVLNINKLNISIFLVLFCYAILGGKIESFDFINMFSYFKLLSSILVGAIVYLFIKKYNFEKLKEHKKIIIWFSIFAFGLFHLINISKVGQMYWQLSLLYPFYILPYFIIGYFITNLRLKYGFFWGCLLHVALNSIATLLMH
ncbi:type II CAAX prenyl endopeptidase Rce1 family protein [Flavobacterium pectinovorum]|uniref:CPBP family intramembrane metalloprotease n=1 Tax=Flavobacterium pectinovorum TaxID=29533 RepID=A0A502F7B3_9FLAO|nr:CPBP family glutamic-type intramembrane protease [Flavobacterium pectinovorum]TPG45258.1 CPBP family intramembrane metalloprotease [Flavobacterium pectinovorum]